MECVICEDYLTIAYCSSVFSCGLSIVWIEYYSSSHNYYTIKCAANTKKILIILLYTLVRSLIWVIIICCVSDNRIVRMWLIFYTLYVIPFFGIFIWYWKSILLKIKYCFINFTKTDLFNSRFVKWTKVNKKNVSLINFRLHRPCFISSCLGKLLN